MRSASRTLRRAPGAPGALRLRALLLAAVAAVLSACGESPTARRNGAGDPARVGEGPRASATGTAAAACVVPSAAQLLEFVDAAFGAGSPDANSVRGKVEAMVRDVRRGDLASARTRAYDIVEFTLRKHRQRALPGGDAEVRRLLNAVLCYVGLPGTITDPDDAWLVLPLDPEQVLRSSDGYAGTRLPADPVSEPTLITITRIPDASFPTPGSGPLETKLDQYPGFYDFGKQSATGAAFKKPVVVGICPLVGLTPDVRDRLRLGHQRQPGAASFEITAPASIDFLACPDLVPQTSASALSGWLRTVAALALPREAHAAMLFGGGVGGLAGEFSPFAPVDPQVNAVGGVGGLAGEFRLPAPMSMNLSAAAPALCAEVAAPIGTPVPTACRPQVSIRTPLGTALQGVPVTFAAPDPPANGSVATEAADGTCGALSASVLAPTRVDGIARACWTLGPVAGQHRVRATVTVGGDVPPGAYFTRTTFPFGATANPPVALVFEQQPAAGSSVVAGVPFPVVVRAVDVNGTRVLGWNGTVTLTVAPGAFSTGASLSASALQGEASFTPVINTAGPQYVITAGATFPGASGATSANGNPFSVAAATAASLVRVTSPQAAPAGTVTQPPPTVRAVDAFGNPVPGASISWTPGGAAGGSVNPGSSLSGATGEAATAWTLGAGSNELLATLGANVASVLFTATGTTSLATLNSCPVGGSGDPINGTRRFGTVIPDAGGGRAIREVTFYLSSAGKANVPSEYRLEMIARPSNTALPTQTVPVTAFLRGNNSETKAVTFTLPQAVLRSSLTLELRVLTNPDGSTLNFNTGPCGLGGTCRVPRGCDATQVTLPDGATYRRSVAIVVKG